MHGKMVLLFAYFAHPFIHTFIALTSCVYSLFNYIITACIVRSEHARHEYNSINGPYKVLAGPYLSRGHIIICFLAAIRILYSLPG